jgi:hypothetical protein
MKRALAPALLLSVLALGASLGVVAPVARAADPDDAVTRISAAPAREGWFLCDAISGPYAAFAGKPDARSISILTILDRRTGRFDTRPYQVGRADAGAGQIYWALSRDGKAVGNVHGVNPGMIDDGGASVPPITSMAVDGKQLECRFISHTRFIGLDSRRSVVVTQEPGGLVYQSFDFARRGKVVNPDGVQRSNVPTLRLAGGTQAGSGDMRFASKGYVYFVSARAGLGPGNVTVQRDGKTVGVDRLVGFTYAPMAGGAGSAGEDQPLGSDAVWSGEGVEACRAGRSADAIDACLVAAMRRGGATAASIAFTQKLIAADNPGYVSAWKQVGPVGIATVTYPFRANTNQGTVLVPASGAPVDVDAYQLTAADKARPDYRAAQSTHSNAFPVPPGEVSIGKAPTAGGTRILVTTATADCHACAPNGSIVVAYDFDGDGRFLGAALVMVA